MKKILVLSFFVIFLFSGCELFNLQMPEKVSVKTKAEYNFSIISVKADETEIDIPKIVNGQIPEDFPLRIYDYNPGKNQTTQQYLLEYKPKAFEIPLPEDIKKLKDFKLKDEIPAIIGLPDFGFEVPNIDITTVPKEISISGSGTAPLPETEIIISDFTISAIDFNGVKSCTIGKGSLEFEVEFDSSWSGGSVTWETLSLTGGIAIADDKFTRNGNKCKALLDNITLGTEATTVSCTIKVKADSADFSKLPKIKVTPKIDEIAEAIVALPSELDTASFSIDEPIPTELKTYVSKIKMGASKINVTYTNGLPEGNDISLTLRSDFLKLAETTETFTAGVTDKTVTFTATGGVVNLQPEPPTPEPNIDFFAEISPDDDNIDTTDPANKTLKVKNVVPGVEYKFSVAVDFEPVIDSVTIKLPSELTDNLNGSFNTNINPKNILKTIKEDTLKNKMNELIDNIKIENLNAYIFVKDPEIFGDLKIAGKAKMGIKQSESSPMESEPIFYFLGNAFNDGEIGFVKTIPEISYDDAKTVTTKMNGDSASYSKEDIDVHDVLFTNKNGNIYLDYDLNFKTSDAMKNEIEVNWNEINTICQKEAINLELAAYVSVSLAFKFNKENPSDKDPFVISLNDFLDNELVIEKIMDTPPEDLQIYLDAIKEVSLIYNTKLPLKITNLDNKEDDMKLTAKIDFTDGSDSIVQEPLTLKHGEITVKDGQIMSLLTKEFKPSLSISIPQGTYYVPRGMNMYVDLSIQIKTDGTISFDDVMGGNQL